MIEEEKNVTPLGRIEKINIEDHMKESYINYSMSVIVSRALPDVRDGLKPVHRRILFDMNSELNLYHDKPTRKSARIVGDVLGKFHPHGDSSVYEAMVRLAQPWAMRYPLVEGQGNFGSRDGDSPAAMRYTEARMQKITDEVMADIEVKTPIDSLLVDIGHNLVGDLLHTSLGVTHSRWRVTVHRTEVTLTLYEWITHSPRLRQTHHCIINR